MKFKDIKNVSQREFKDISSEQYRVYVYPGYAGLINTIERFIYNPVGLSVSKSGHYIIGSDGVVYFMPYGFVELRWKAEENQPNVVC